MSSQTSFTRAASKSTFNKTVYRQLALTKILAELKHIESTHQQSLAECGGAQLHAAIVHIEQAIGALDALTEARLLSLPEVL